MVEAGAGEHQPVEMGDGETGGRTGLQMPQHAAGGRAVPVERVALAPEQRRRRIGLAVDDIGDVTEHGRVENGINAAAVIAAPLVQALDAIARSDGIGVGMGLGGHAVLPFEECAAMVRHAIGSEKHQFR